MLYPHRFSQCHHFDSFITFAHNTAVSYNEGKVEVTHKNQKGSLMYPENSSNLRENLPNTQNQTNNGNWMPNEHSLFLQALKLHGQNWELISAFVGTRTITQVRSHFQKYNQKLRKEIQRQKDMNVQLRESNGRAITRFGPIRIETKESEQKEQKTKSIVKKNRSSSRHSNSHQSQAKIPFGIDQNLPETQEFMIPKVNLNRHLLEARLIAQNRQRFFSYAKTGDQLKISPNSSFFDFNPKQDRFEQILKKSETESQGWPQI